MKFISSSDGSVWQQVMRNKSSSERCALVVIGRFFVIGGAEFT